MDEVMKQLLIDVATGGTVCSRIKPTYSMYLIHLMSEAANAEVNVMHSTGRGTYAEVNYDGQDYKVTIEAK